MKLLLLSNSTIPGEDYLQYAKPYIRDFLGNEPKKILFIPYAAVTFSYDEYERKVNSAFKEIGHRVYSIHNSKNIGETIKNSDVIITGGGNTWVLLQQLQQKGMLELLKEKIESGTPYIGWSAGSNLACPSIKTTNDMPIVEPKNFSALSLIPFQINPHYLDKNPEGHGGETREDRIMEFLNINRNMHVAGLREGTMFMIKNKTIQLLGNRSCRIFKFDFPVKEINPTENIHFLID